MILELFLGAGLGPCCTNNLGVNLLVHRWATFEGWFGIRFCRHFGLRSQDLYRQVLDSYPELFFSSSTKAMSAANQTLVEQKELTPMKGTKRKLKQRNTEQQVL
jgi:hypothetical protein